MLRKSILLAVAIALSPAAAFAANDSKSISDGAAKGQATEGTAQPTTSNGKPCKPTAAKPCPVDAVNYNSSKSNSGNMTVTSQKTHDSASPN